MKEFSGKHSSYKSKNEISAEKLDEDVIQSHILPANKGLDSADVDRHCEVIHIGSVCAGYSSILNFHTLLKSLYFYRINPIHFHLITNKASEISLRTLFDSWNVPQGMYSHLLYIIGYDYLLTHFKKNGE